MSTIITKRQFPHYHKYTMDLAGRPLTLEVGKLADFVVCDEALNRKAVYLSGVLLEP